MIVFRTWLGKIGLKFEPSDEAIEGDGASYTIGYILSDEQRRELGTKLLGNDVGVIYEAELSRGML